MNHTVTFVDLPRQSVNWTSSYVD